MLKMRLLCGGGFRDKYEMKVRNLFLIKGELCKKFVLEIF
jgi:hypothetical protein